MTSVYDERFTDGSCDYERTEIEQSCHIMVGYHLFMMNGLQTAAVVMSLQRLSKAVTAW
jgi:hypothetical protein